MPKIGAHVSAAVSIANAPLNANNEGCECFQFFSRPPQGGKASQLTPKIIADFKKNCRKYNLESYIHAPYYINLASRNNRIKYGSISVIKEELERANLLGVKYVMTHLGSAKEYANRDQAVLETIKSLKKILSGYNGETIFLIENAAGSGAILGANFKELKKILNSLKKYPIGICLDVMHAFASGYKTESIIEKFNEEIGLKYLKLIHANDAKSKLGSHIDRHEHIGFGNIGEKNFFQLINNPELEKINFILETPSDKRAKDVLKLKQLRQNKK